jgi:hypothetical protein
MSNIDWNAILRDTIGDETLIGAGTFLTEDAFDPNDPWGHVPTNDEIVAVTSNDISVTANPTITDMFEDVNGAPNGTIEGVHLDRWAFGLAFTSITLNSSNLKFALSAADVSTLQNGAKKVKPRNYYKEEDFIGMWWVCRKNNGGALAVHIAKALSTNGLNLTATKTNKGTIAQAVTAYVSAKNLDEMPMEFYDILPEGTTGTATITQNLDENVETTITAKTVDLGSALTGTLTAAEGYVLDTVTVTMGGTYITKDVYSAGTISIEEVTADVVITATTIEE